MSFIPSFTLSQSIDGKTLTITDTSNYGVDATHHKTNFLARQLVITSGDNPTTPVTYSFPYTGSGDNVQDTYTLTVSYDNAYTIVLNLTYQDNSILSATNNVITTQFIVLNKSSMLSMIKPCDCNDYSLMETIDTIDIAIEAANYRASNGDIASAYQLLSYAYEKTQFFVNT